MARQSVRVHIFNQSYSLLTDSDPAALDALAHQIDELMTSIAGRSQSGDSTRVAVLACLHLADKLREAEAKLAKYEGKSDRLAQMAQMLEAALSPAGTRPSAPSDSAAQ